jgi:hypothetical protein
MHLIKSLIAAAVLAFAIPTVSMAEEAAKAEEKIDVAALPAPVKDGFAKEVSGGTITSAKKLGGDKTRYQIKYKSADGKEHQITLGEDGVPTRKKKEDKGGDEK